ncbi:MAG: helix-turn-helix domain-containing protein [Simkaniaceae bacterium]
MNDEIKIIGQIFKEKRKDMGLSLKEVENSTSIRSSYLQAIENGQCEQFLSSIYIIGFIRQYATFLGLDADKLVQEHPEAFQMPGEKHEFAYGIGTLEVRGSMGGGVKWFPNLMWIGASVAILGLAYYFAHYVGLI